MDDTTASKPAMTAASAETGENDQGCCDHRSGDGSKTIPASARINDGVWGETITEQANDGGWGA
jgi:hypothetical protein